MINYIIIDNDNGNCKHENEKNNLIQNKNSNQLIMIENLKKAYLEMSQIYQKNKQTLILKYNLLHDNYMKLLVLFNKTCNNNNNNNGDLKIFNENDENNTSKT